MQRSADLAQDLFLKASMTYIFEALLLFIICYLTSWNELVIPPPLEVLLVRRVIGVKVAEVLGQCPRAGEVANVNERLSREQG